MSRENDNGFVCPKCMETVYLGECACGPDEAERIEQEAALRVARGSWKNTEMFIKAMLGKP